MKKPTLAQLKKRPALWFVEGNYYWFETLYISYPDGSVDEKHGDDSWNTFVNGCEPWSEWLNRQDQIEFVGWL